MTSFTTIRFVELLAACCGLLTIYLIVRNSIWNWIFGMITVTLYLFVFLQAKLYADACLQMIFFILQFYGLYQWLYGGAQHSVLTIRKATLQIYLYAAVTTIGLFCGISYILQHFTDSNTVCIDAFTTALSLVAQWMMGKKWMEHWLLWMIVNCISVEMYVGKNLHFTAALYAIFFVLNIFGYQQWRRRANVAEYKQYQIALS